MTQQMTNDTDSVDGMARGESEVVLQFPLVKNAQGAGDVKRLLIADLFDLIGTLGQMQAA